MRNNQLNASLTKFIEQTLMDQIKHAAMNTANQNKEYSHLSVRKIFWLYAAFSSLLIFCIGQFQLNAQVYPVSVTTQLIPPYSVNLADYAAPGCEQLKVIILQRDLTQAPYRMYLKMEIEWNGTVIIRTSAGYRPSPLILDPGIPTVISGSDLYSFLDPQNMDFVGYSRETYLRTKTLPEGAYRISFTAYDYARPEVALSAGGTMYCYLAKTDPPLLNLPVNNTGITALPSQYITFQWISRNLSSPNSAQSTRYLFELFEIRLDGRSPSEIVQSSRPVFTSETDRTTLAYTIADPPLEPGMRYAWRVRAFDTQGSDYIRNDGYSEVFNFVYGVADVAALPGSTIENFAAEAVSPRKAKLSWDASTEFDSYKVYYRLQGEEDKWLEEETVKNSFDLPGLTPGNIYECRVQGKKSSIWGGFSDTDTVKTPPAAVVACGSPLQSQNISNREPLKELRRLQEIDANGIMVTVVEASGSNGYFTGKGYVQVPLFANCKLRCEFSGILVNTDYQLLQGNIQLITDKPGGKDNALWDIDAEFEGGGNNGMVVDGTEGASVTFPDVLIPGPQSISLDTVTQEIIVVTESGETVRADVSQQLDAKAKTITIKDKEGNLYSVDTKTGKASYIGKAPAEGTAGQELNATTLDADKGIVYFEAAQGQTIYALDQRNKLYATSTLFTEEYGTLAVPDGTPYDVPFKLIPVGETDVILARVLLKDKNLNPDSIVFQSSTGTQYAAKPSGTKGQYLLTLPSGKDNDGIDVYAIYPNKHGQPYILGKVSVVSYSMKQPKVVLVPVNGNTLDAAKVKEELDKVYLPVAVDWQVTQDASFDVTVDSLKVSGSGLFSQYTDGMKKLNSNFIAHKGNSFDPSALYLFVLKWSDDPNATGDMPRSKQFGYLFTKTAQNGGDAAIYRTIAHELSHGTFSLKHTFDSQYDIAKASTQNLMDYTSGTELVKHEWDAIHEPGLVIGIFESDEDGALKIIDCGSSIRPTKIQALITAIKSCSGVDDIIPKLTDAELNNYLCPEERKNILKCIASGLRVGTEDEKSIIRIIKTTPLNQKAKLIELISKEPNLLANLHNSIDGEELTSYYKELILLLKLSKNKLYWENISKNFGNLEKQLKKKPITEWAKNKMYYWLDIGLIDYVTEGRIVYLNDEIASNNRIKFDQFTSVLAMWKLNEINGVDLDPFEVVRIYFVSESEQLGYPKGEYVDLPAVALHFLIQKQFNRDTWLAINSAFVLSTLGSGSIVTFWGGVDCALGLGAILEDNYHNQLTKSPEGQAVLTAWKYVNLTLLTRMGYKVVTIGFPTAWKNLMEALSKLRSKNPILANQVENEAKQAYSEYNLIDDIEKGFNNLINKRKELGLPEAGSLTDDATLARLKINNNEYYGVNSKYQNPKSNVNLKVNAQTKTHAEADAVYKAIKAGEYGKVSEAEMWVDRDLCRSCGDFNGVGSLARELGVKKIIIHSPSGNFDFFPPINN